MSSNSPPHELSSWKEIASYLGVGVRTAQLWERERGLPVKRLPGPRGRVYASVEALTIWRASGAPTAAIEESQSPFPSHFRIPAVVGAVLLIGLVVFAMRQPHSEVLWLADIQPLTSSPGMELHPSISPNATLLAFVRVPPDGAPELCVQEIRTGLVQVVEPVLVATHARWSPDSALLAYATASPEGVQVMVRDKANHRRPVATLSGEDRKTEMINALIVDWIGNEELIVSERAGPGKPLALIGVNITNGARRPISEPAVGPGDVQPAVRGHQLAFARYTSHSEGDIYLQDLRDATVRQLTTDHARIDGIAWTENGLVIGTMKGGRGVGLHQLDLNGVMTRLSGIEGASNFPTVAKDELVFQTQRRDVNIWEHSTITQAIAPSTTAEFGPAYGPDGRSIAFISKRSGATEVWMNVENSTVQLTSLGQTFTDSPRWAPDGRTITFTSQREGNRDIYLVDVTTKVVRQFTSEASEEGRASYSHDGKTIYYRSNRTGSDEIWKHPLKGSPSQLTRDGGFEAFESADGTTLYYIKARNKAELWQIPVGGGKETIAHPGVVEGRWSIARDGIYFLRPTIPPTVLHWNPTTRKESLVFTLPTKKRLDFGFSASPDARRFSWTQVDQDDVDILRATIKHR